MGNNCARIVAVGGCSGNAANPAPAANMPPTLPPGNVAKPAPPAAPQLPPIKVEFTIQNVDANGLSEKMVSGLKANVGDSSL